MVFKMVTLCTKLFLIREKYVVNTSVDLFICWRKNEVYFYETYSSLKMVLQPAAQSMHNTSNLDDVI